MASTPTSATRDDTAMASTVRFRCPRCHDVATVATRCERCRLEMLPADDTVMTSVHGETRSGFRPTGVNAVVSLMIVNTLVAGALALAKSELWFLAALFAGICLFSLALATSVVAIVQSRGLAGLKRWPASMTLRASDDVQEGEIVCVAGRVVAATAETIAVHGEPCVAVSTSNRGGVSTRAVRFIVEEASGRRVVVNASELIVCRGSGDHGGEASVPVGADVEVIGIAQWAASGAEDSTFRGGPGLLLTGVGGDPVRVRVCEAANRMRVHVEGSGESAPRGDADEIEVERARNGRTASSE